MENKNVVGMIYILLNQRPRLEMLKFSTLYLEK